MAEPITDSSGAPLSRGETPTSPPPDAPRTLDRLPPTSPVSEDAAAPAAGLEADEPVVVSLVNRASQQRDPDAFGELYDRYLDRIYRYLYFRTSHASDAEDLAEQ